MIRIDTKRCTKDKVIAMLCKLTDDQTTPALRKHVMTMYVGGNPSLTQLKSVLSRLKAIAHQHTRFDVQQFRAMMVKRGPSPAPPPATPSYEFISYAEGWRCTKCDRAPWKRAIDADSHCVRIHGDPSFMVPAPKKTTAMAAH